MKLVTAVALALGAAFTSLPAVAQQVVERGIAADPQTLDPRQATTAEEFAILRDLYEGLVTYDASGRLIAGAAIGWSISDDALTYTFTLRETEWSNGLAVTAGDFTRAFDALLDPATAAPDAGLFAAVDDVTAPDESTLVIALNTPDPLLLHHLARPSAAPLPPGETGAPRIPAATSPVNGAYRFDGFEPGNGLWLTKNRSFHDAGNVAIETIVYRSGDRAAALAAFDEGTLTTLSDLSIFQLAATRAAYEDAFREAPYAGTYFLAVNVEGALADPALRRAVALAIDRIALADDIWLGAMIPTLALVPAGIADLGTPAEAALGPNDPAARLNEARDLLVAAGYDTENPLELTLAVSDSALNRDSADLIAANLAEIGIALRIVVRAPSDHQADLVGDRAFDLATVGWIAPAGQAGEFLTLFGSQGPNITGYTDPDVDAWLGEAAAMADRTVRTALYAAADRRIAADLPVIALMHYASINLVSPELTGWEDNLLDIHLSRWLAFPSPEDGE